MKSGNKQKIQIAEETPFDDTASSLSADDVQEAIDNHVTDTARDDHTQYALLDGRTGDVLLIDDINEFTLDHGVDIETVNLKDGNISNVNYIDFKLLPTGATAEGRLIWNSDEGTLNLGMPGGNVNLQIGQEQLFRAINKQGVDINNGQAIYISGASGLNPEIQLANASTPSGVRTLALATEDIINNQKGYYTTFGLVRGVDTSFCVNDGDEIFLDLVDGGLTVDKLNHPNFRIRVGYCLRKHATEGIIFVNIKSYQWLKRFQSMQNPTGFDEDQIDLRGDISFVNGSRTFSIAPKAGQDYFNFWHFGREWRKASQEDLIISPTEGEHYIYYDSDAVLQEAVNPSDANIDALIRTAVLVAYIRWDNTNNVYVLFNNERHLNALSGNHHSYHHFIDRTRWLAGGSLSDFDIGDTTNDSGAQFSVSASTIADKDIISVESALSSTAGMEILYRDGVSGDWRRTTEPGFSVLTDITAGIDTTGRLVWNEFVGGAWQLSVVTSGDFVLCHVIQTNGENSGEKFFAIVGQNEYANLNAAKEGAVIEKDNLILNGLAGPEFLFLGTIIFQTRDSYSNSVKATVRETDSSDNYIDWRTNPSVPGAGSTDHGNLAGLSDDDHIQYALLTGRTGDILKVDQVDEVTPDAGVTVDGLLIKDGGVPQSAVDDHAESENLILANQIFS